MVRKSVDPVFGENKRREGANLHHPRGLEKTVFGLARIFQGLLLRKRRTGDVFPQYIKPFLFVPAGPLDGIKDIKIIEDFVELDGKLVEFFFYYADIG